jgi:hypothetical protein
VRDTQSRQLAHDTCQFQEPFNWLLSAAHVRVRATITTLQAIG